MKAKTKDSGYESFKFLKEWHDLMEKENFSDEQYGRVFRAMNNYCYFDIETELPSPEDIIFQMSKPILKREIRL